MDYAIPGGVPEGDRCLSPSVVPTVQSSVEELPMENDSGLPEREIAPTRYVPPIGEGAGGAEVKDTSSWPSVLNEAVALALESAAVMVQSAREL